MAVKNQEDLQKAVAKIGYPCVLKTCEGGYDGHGQEVLHSDADLAKCAGILSTKDAILEGWVPFRLECSVMVGRNEDGEVTVFQRDPAHQHCTSPDFTRTSGTR